MRPDAWRGVQLRPRPGEAAPEKLVVFGPFVTGYAQAVEEMARIIDPRKGEEYHLILSRFRP